jgi:hypothetical protein
MWDTDAPAVWCGAVHDIPAIRERHGVPVNRVDFGLGAHWLCQVLKKLGSRGVAQYESRLASAVRFVWHACVWVPGYQGREMG